MITNRPLRVLVVGDPFFQISDFRRGLAALESRASLSYLQIETTLAPPARTESERRLREYAGDPAVVAAAVAGHDVLVVHGAPVSAEVLAVDGLRLVCCARGGPVNVDVEAATAAGVPVCNTPGKNAEAVAELTIAFALMHIRGVGPSSRRLSSGELPGESVFDGRGYFGHEAPSTTLGLVGLGHVGRRVAGRARALGFTVLAHDPYVQVPDVDGVEMVGMDALLARSDIVSLHARATPQTRHMIGSSRLGAMKPGAFLINTAREQLVDEPALLAALREGRLAGAALDVMEHTAEGNPLLDLPQVVVTPHIGGATYETLRRGAEMAARSVIALIEGEVPPFVVNTGVLRAPVHPGGAG